MASRVGDSLFVFVKAHGEAGQMAHCWTFDATQVHDQLPWLMAHRGTC